MPELQFMAEGDFAIVQAFGSQAPERPAAFVHLMRRHGKPIVE